MFLSLEQNHWKVTCRALLHLTSLRPSVQSIWIFTNIRTVSVATCFTCYQHNAPSSFLKTPLLLSLSLYWVCHTDYYIVSTHYIHHWSIGANKIYVQCTRTLRSQNSYWMNESCYPIQDNYIWFDPAYPFTLCLHTVMKQYRNH